MTAQEPSFSSPRAIAAEFDQWAAIGRGDSMAAGHRYATETLLKDLALSPEAVVLDAGCGIGWVLNDLLGDHITMGIGIDLSPEMVAIAQSRCQHSHMQFLTVDTTNTPFEDNQFSHVVSVESLYYNPQPLETLKEWLRISQPGGRIGLVLDLYQENPVAADWVSTLPITAHNFSIKEWRSLLEEAGWSQISHRCLPLPATISVDEFTGSGYFRDYDRYLAYCEVGSLLLSAQKPAT